MGDGWKRAIAAAQASRPPTTRGAAQASAACRWCGQSPCDGGLPGDPCPPWDGSVQAPVQASRPLLGARGQIYVTLSAARTYLQDRMALPDPPARFTRPQSEIARLEVARRELTALLITATCAREPTAGATAKYRARSRATQLDVSANVAEQDGLLVVVSAGVREYV